MSFENPEKKIKIYEKPKNNKKKRKRDRNAKAKRELHKKNRSGSKRIKPEDEVAIIREGLSEYKEDLYGNETNLEYPEES